MLFTALTGIIYPAIVTGIAQLCFPWRANGSLIKLNNTFIGSDLIGQSFSDPGYFWSRPSATLPFPYNAENSSGSNLGPSNPALFNVIKMRVARVANAADRTQLVPVDLVTASGSGLDPEISPAAAFYQVSRIAAARNVSEINLEIMIRSLLRHCTLGILGEPRLNVLELNLALASIPQNELGSLFKRKKYGRTPTQP